MLTLEHLFVQIFERKNWIEGQLRLQIESYGESLGYNLLADGVRPPEWLWTVGFDAPHRADPKEIYGTQITSDFLFPPTLATTPANQRTLFTLPTLKETNLSQNSFFTETCANIGGAVLVSQCEKTSKQQDMVEPEIAEAYAEFSTFSRIQRSRSRQRDLENRLNEKSEATVAERKDTVNTGIMTRSRASTRSERTKKSTVVKSVPDKVTDCRNSQSRHLAFKHNQNDLSKPDEPSEFIDGACRTSETQLVLCPAASMEENLAISCNIDAVISSGCPAGTVSKVPIIDHFELKIGDIVASTLPEADLSVEPKKLLFDGIELCLRNEKPFMALETESQVECAELEHLRQCDSNGNSLSCFEQETKGRESGISVREENASVAEDELRHRKPGRAVVSSTNGHISEKDDVSHALQVNNVFTGSQKEKLKLLKTMEPEDNPKTTVYNSVPSNLPARESLELISRYDLSKNSFMASPAQCTIKPDNKEKDTKGTSDDPFQHTDICNNDGPVSPLTEKVETSFSNKDDVATSLEFGKRSIAQLAKMQQTPENRCLSDYLEFTVDDTPNASDKVSKTQNQHTNSCSCDKNLGSCSKNDYISSYPDNFSMPRGATKDKIHQDLNVAVEKSVISWTTALSDREFSSSLPAAQCILRSMGGHEKSTSFELNEKNVSRNSKRPSETQLRGSGVSWSKKRKMNCHSNDFLATPPRAKVQPGLNSQGDSGDPMNEENDSGASVKFKPLSLAKEMESNRADVAVDGCFDVLSQSNELSLTKIDTKELLFPVSYEDGVPNTFPELDARTIKSTSSKMAESYNSEEDGRDLLCSQNTSNHEISRCSSLSIEINDKEVCDNCDNLDASNTTKPSQYIDNSVECDGTMPEFEGFSIDIPSIVEDDILLNSSEVESLKEEKASLLEHLYYSCPSTKHKINKLPDVYQSSTTGFLELMRTTNSFESENDEFPGLYENMGLEFDDASVGRSHSQSIPPSSARLVQETGKPPLTPLVEKFSERKLSGRSGASSETVGSKPELTCFRIDEDISTADENDVRDGIYTSEERDCLKGTKAASNRKALQDVTAAYQNVEPSKIEAFADKKVGQHMSLGNACPSNMKFKENRIHSVDGNRVSKVAELIRSRSGKAEIAGEANERNRSQGNLQKGCKPTNIVSNISSFIPLVKQKQQLPAVKGKKDIRVKALEAAEAAKRLEEKKQNEREMRKEAAKVERIRLKQEKELKQKQEDEQRKKKEADIAARKRQREEEEKKGKERKRKCIEEARKLQKEKEERINVEKEEKDARRKASDEKEQWKKELVQDTKGQLKSDKEEVVVGCKDEEPSTSVAGARTHGSNVLEAQETSKNVVQQSYEMSPYRDSDDEDSDDGDEEIRRRRKYYPSWARRECLEQILLSKRHIDPREIFSRKSSFNLSEVLSPHIPRRQL